MVVFHVFAIHFHRYVDKVYKITFTQLPNRLTSGMIDTFEIHHHLTSDKIRTANYAPPCHDRHGSRISRYCWGGGGDDQPRCRGGGSPTSDVDTFRKKTKELGPIWGAPYRSAHAW